MRALHTINRLPWSAGGTDAHGNTIATYGAAQPTDVFGWSEPGSDEPQTGTDRVVVDAKVYAPADVIVDHRDRFVLPSGTYEVAGDVEDYNHGPFRWAPGVVINLRRVEG